ncbi:hypothetical protein HTZ77_13245 [Nonomuraea sp. SMC257]|uniref:Secreted protein n=1 Tax=Nonomuraea montanisoli TaxID=2741721 RepID=A0A7Y6M279_9ACTN|nr:hypothetical protein [Nonomuraea montanisoli]NUW32388.1 hypothetical protein [Nonomuraea montanisoli]
MSIARPLIALSGLAATLIAFAPAAQAAAATSWGPYYAPGHAAKAAGTLAASGEDHADIPAADVVKIAGTVQDNTRSTATCGWAVFRVTYRDSSNNLPFMHHSFRDCSYGGPKRFSFSHHDVYQVELKVCAQPRSATKPSDTCLYAGTWKVLYLSK